MRPAADRDRQPGGLTAGEDDVGRLADQVHQIRFDNPDRDHTYVLDSLLPSGGDITGQRQLGAYRIVPGPGIGGHGDEQFGLTVPAGGQPVGAGSEHPHGRVLPPARRIAQSHSGVEFGVAAVAGDGELQPHRVTGLGDEGVRVQVRDGGQPSQRCRSPVVQPVTRVKRLCGFGIGGKLAFSGVDYRSHIESGRNRGDLVTVQPQRITTWPGVLQQVSRHDVADRTERGGDLHFTCRAGDLD